MERMKVKDLEDTLEPLFAAFRARRTQVIGSFLPNEQSLFVCCVVVLSFFVAHTACCVAAGPDVQGMSLIYRAH